MLRKQSQLPQMPELSSIASSTCRHAQKFARSGAKIMRTLFAALISHVLCITTDYMVTRQEPGTMCKAVQCNCIHLITAAQTGEMLL